MRNNSRKAAELSKSNGRSEFLTWSPPSLGAGTPNCPHSPILLDLKILVLFGVWGSN
jgi:hypothetical protein